MKRIVIAGGIGAGKSAATEYLAIRGFPIIDADDVARAVTQPGEPAWQAMRDAFGDAVVELRRGVIVEEEQRLCALYDQVVGAHRDEIDADVKMANGILVVAFKAPVAVSVDRLYSNAVGYVSAARRDPDGKAIRMALSQKVTLNSMMAA